MSTAEEKACNLDYLLGNLGGNKGAAKRLVGMYLGNHANLLQNFDQAVERRNLLEVRQIVHDIRGSCVLFSANRCLDLARRIEEALRGPLEGVVGKNGALPDWVVDCTQLHDALEAMAVVLHDFMDGE